MSDQLPAAVLWDLDGTIIDSEPYWMSAEAELVHRYGGTWTDEDGLSLVGNDLLASGRVIAERGGVPLAPEAIVEALVEEVTARLWEKLLWRPGARELLSELAAAGVPMALVTMSYRALVEPVLAALPPNTFAVVVTGDEVTHGKPHPEAYLKAAHLLGVDPRQCVAIEDSPTGVASAMAAGVPTIGVAHLADLTGLTRGPVRSTLEGVVPLDLLSLTQAP